MADTEEPQIASAVLIPDETPAPKDTADTADTVLPDAPAPPSAPGSLSQEAHITSAYPAPNDEAPTSLPCTSPPPKRQRASPSPAPPPPKRPRHTTDQQTRAKRLFGSLLSTLSSSTKPTTTQRRRASIEARQQEKLRAQADEYDRERLRQQAKSDQRRREEQVVWEGWEREVRFEEMRGRAGSLRTRGVPVLYYKPWSLRPHEKAQIERQRREVEEDIERELDEVDERRAEALARQRIIEQRENDRDDRIAEQRDNDRDNRMITEQREKDTGDINMDEPMVDTNEHDQRNGKGKGERVNGAAHEGEESANKSRQHIEQEGNRDIAEDNDEMVVEAGEDAVIY